ncbi:MULTISPECIES: hypothetical protein [Bacteria]|uniref:hypothetical protein n=1 Tax=Bacteria TaxID=2 RepID=UPI003C7C3044
MVNLAVLAGCERDSIPARVRILLAIELTEHYRVGYDLARRLADELGPDCDVRILMAGDHGGWQHVET